MRRWGVAFALTGGVLAASYFILPTRATNPLRPSERGMPRRGSRAATSRFGGPPGFVEARAAFRRAAVAGDPVRLGRFLSDDFTLTDRYGRLRNKAAVLRELTPAASISGEAPELLRSFSDSVIVVARRPCGGAGCEVRLLQVWALEDREWHILAHQSVPVGATSAPRFDGASFPSPPSTGASADIQAIDGVSAAIRAGRQAGNSRPFNAFASEQFVAVTASGDLVSKADRVRAIDARPPASRSRPQLSETSTRVHGNVAVTTRVSMPDDAGVRIRSTLVSTRQGDDWRRAAIVSTPVR